MTTRQRIIMGMAIIVILNFLLLIIFGEKGLVDLYFLRQEREKLKVENQNLIIKTVELEKEIDRLKHDPEYQKSVARKELGVIGEDEVIVRILRGKRKK